jgi:hypothetical protein
MMRVRAVATGAVALTLVSLAWLAPVGAVVPACAAAGAHHAAVVAEHGDGSVATRCVAFDTSEISGEQLLTLSGIAWSGQTFGGFGQAVCALDGEPARYLDCPGKDSYWAVFVSSGGGPWHLSNVGISNLVIHDGDAEGLRYVPAVGDPAAPTSPAGNCPTSTTAATAAPQSAVPSAGSSLRVGETAGPSGSFAAATSFSAAASGAAASATTAAAAAPPGTGTPPSVPTPTPGGPDPGILAASLAGGGLAGLALLRLVARRRQRT